MMYFSLYLPDKCIYFQFKIKSSEFDFLSLFLFFNRVNSSFLVKPWFMIMEFYNNHHTTSVPSKNAVRIWEERVLSRLSKETPLYYNRPWRWHQSDETWLKDGDDGPWRGAGQAKLDWNLGPKYTVALECNLVRKLSSLFYFTCTGVMLGRGLSELLSGRIKQKRLNPNLEDPHCPAIRVL